MRYHSKRPKRQFLAGVTCKGCGATDTTVQMQVFEPVFDEYIECVVCNYSERRPEKEDLLHVQQHTADNGVGVVKFLDKKS